MKKISVITLLTLLALSLGSCKKENQEKPNPNPTVSGFDIWVPVNGASGKTVGKGTDAYIVVRSEKLNDGEISIEGKGAATGATTLTPNAVVKDGFYYSVSRGEPKFGKFQIDGVTVKTKKEIEMPNILDRRFSHAWLSDNVLVMVSSTGKKQEVNWVKVDVEKMSILSEGKLNLPAPKANEQFNSSGLLGFRKSDNKLIYTYAYQPLAKKGKLLTERRSEYYMAFIDVKTMNVLNVEADDRAEMPSSTSFGETRQDKAFFDRNGDYYIACATIIKEEMNGPTSHTTQRSHIFRVKNGETKIDKSYNGYTQPRGKIVTMTQIRDGEVLLYMQDPKFATPENPKWDSKNNPYVFYWLVVNLQTKEVKHLADIPFSNGNFSQLAVVSGNTVFIGTNTAKDVSQIYEYDILTGKVKLGATLQKGFQFDRLVPVKAK